MTDKSAAAIREFAYKHAEPKVIWNDGNVSICPDEEKIESLLSDLTALIAEHYVSKEVFEEQRRIYLRLFDEEINCMYCEAKIRRGSAIILCKECAENTEV